MTAEPTVVVVGGGYGGVNAAKGNDLMVDRYAEILGLGA